MMSAMDPALVQRLSQVVLETRVDVFRRALTGELVADVELLTIKLKLDAPME